VPKLISPCLTKGGETLLIVLVADESKEPSVFLFLQDTSEGETYPPRHGAIPVIAHPIAVAELRSIQKNRTKVERIHGSILP